ncbi:MAG: hypothetical protein PHP52_14130 [Bacteroidales bacterium]|nr:hypothetical protein [Bacteroidales bacterium]
MNDGKGDNVLLVIISIATLLVAVIGATFAFFTAQLSGEEEGQTMRINSGTIGTEFEGGSAISALGAYPRDEDWGTKKFVLKGSTQTDAEVNYKLGLNISINTFESDALKYTLIHHEDTFVDGEGEINGVMVPEVSELTSILDSGVQDLGIGHFQGPTPQILIDPDDPEKGFKTVTHVYLLTIYFPETGVDQSDDQEAELNAWIVIEEPDIPTTSS